MSSEEKERDSDDETIVPSLSTLFANPSLKVGRDLGPLFQTDLTDKLDKHGILLIVKMERE